MGTAILTCTHRTRLGPDDRGTMIPEGLGDELVDLNDGLDTPVDLSLEPREPDKKMRRLHGVDLFPGKPTKIDEVDLRPLLLWGHRHGLRLLKHGVLSIDFDRSSDLGRDQRIADFVRLATQLRGLESTMSEEERRAAIEKIKARENELRGGRPEGSASDDTPPAAPATSPPPPSAEPPPPPVAPATTQNDTEIAAPPAPTLSVETVGTMTFAQLEPLVRGSTDVELLDSLLQAEQAGKNRKTVVELLEDRWTELAASKE